MDLPDGGARPGAALVRAAQARPAAAGPDPFRRAQIEERTRAIQRLDKVLQDAGIKLTSVASKTLTKSGRAMLEALLSGERDAAVLAELAKGRMRSKIPQLRDALTGRFNDAHHGVIIAQILAHIDFLDESIETLTARIDEAMAPFAGIRRRVMTIPGVKERAADQLIAECGVDIGPLPHGGTSGVVGRYPGRATTSPAAGTRTPGHGEDRSGCGIR